MKTNTNIHRARSRICPVRHRRLVCADLKKESLRMRKIRWIV